MKLAFIATEIKIVVSQIGKKIRQMVQEFEALFNAE